MPSTGLIHELESSLARLPQGALLVGFSGGLDSTVLLHLLASIPSARARGLRAVHVDHGLQSNSALWANHCAEFCAGLRIGYVAIAAKVTITDEGIEAAARNARYAGFAAQVGDAEILTLAHHADDQAETVLLKLLRGAGPEGIAGMSALRAFAKGLLWRPLLSLPRARLIAYAREKGLRWIEDPSNLDTRLRRNFVRAEILPRLRERWPDATVAIAHSASWARAAAEFIDAQAHSALDRLRGPDPATLVWRGWLALPDALRDPVLRLWLRGLELDEPAHFHVAELERQLAGAGESRAPCVRWPGCELRRFRDLLYAMQPIVPVPAGWSTVWDGAPLQLPAGGSICLRADSQGAPAPLSLTVHYRSGGEHIKPSGAAHTRELRLLLQEFGIPPWERDRIPLVSAGSELIAVGDLVLSSAGRVMCDQLGAEIVWARERET